MPAKNQQIADDSIQTPSRITPLHVCDRETSKVAGAPRAWRKLTEVEDAFRLDRLGDQDSNEARARLSAGLTYAKLWDCAQGRGQDSTQAFDFVGGGQGIPLSEAQRAAIQRMVAIEMHLGERDRTIIRAVCGTGHTPAQAIALARLRSDTRVSARLCEALDALADAIDRTAKSRRR